MSGQTTGWVLRHGPKDRAMRWVLHTIADAANRDGENARPGMQAIVEGSLYSAGAARRAIARLIEDGWLEVTEKGGGAGHESVYRVLMDRPEVTQDEQQFSDKRAVLTQKSRTAMSNNAEPSLLSLSTDTDTCGEKEDPMIGFVLFWKTYPQRNGRIVGRNLCEPRWRKLSLEDKRAAYRGAKNYRADVDAGLTIAKDPDRWLRDRLWTDWQDSARSPETPARVHEATSAVEDPDRASWDPYANEERSWEL